MMYESDFCPGRFMSRLSEVEGHAARSALCRARSTSFRHHLDFACGTGRAVRFVDDAAENTVGVDISEEMLRRARRDFPDATFVVGDLASDQDLLTRLGPFDLVTLWRFISGAEPSLRLNVLSAVSRAMDEGGVLLVNNNANRASLHSVAVILRCLIRGHALRDSQPWRSSLAHEDLRRLLADCRARGRRNKGNCVPA